MSDEEFDDFYTQKVIGIERNSDFENRINRKLEEFKKDYDIDDLKINDHLILRSLIRAIIHLEDMETLAYNMRVDGIDQDNIILFDKLNRVISELRSDISRLQDDLKITRRIRKGDQQESVMALIENLKVKAKEFYQSKMAYIHCTKCNELLCTVWTLYPNSKNKIVLTCDRELADGEKCGTVVTVTTKELLENRGYNRPEIIPVGIK